MNQASSLRKIDGRVSYFGEEDRIDDGIVLEVLENSHPFDLWRSSVNVELAQLLRVSLAGDSISFVSVQGCRKGRTNLESVDVVRKYDDLVSSIFVVANQELTRLELFRVHAVE